MKIVEEKFTIENSPLNDKVVAESFFILKYLIDLSGFSLFIHPICS